jgi:hypothetical protein
MGSPQERQVAILRLRLFFAKTGTPAALGVDAFQQFARWLVVRVLRHQLTANGLGQQQRCEALKPNSSSVTSRLCISWNFRSPL